MRKHLSTILIVLALVAGLGLMLYPTVSNWWNSYHQTQAISNYTENVARLSDADYTQILEEARAYNDRLRASGAPLDYLNDEQQAEYETMLDVSGTGAIGYIDIPVINCRLPIYHGTDDAVLQVGVGHIGGTSLPVGGLGTHAVLSGHRGLPSARLFTDLNQLQVGDVFAIHVLNEVLAYQVDQILTVLPTELDALAIDPDMDYVTLITCTPYGINSHRLLVRGHRIDGFPTTAIVSEASRVDPGTVALVIAVPLIVVGAAAIVLVRVRRVRLR